MALWCTSLLLAISAVCVQSQFLQPPDTTVPNIKNPVYTVGQNLDLQWNTDVSSVDVTMWQQGNGTLFTLLAESTASSYSWVVSYETFNPASGTTFLFAGFQHGSTSESFESHYFDIVPSSSTSTASSTTSSATSTKTKAGATTSSASTNSAAQSSSTLSGGAIAGIVIGALAVVALIIGVFMLRRRKRRQAEQTSTAELGNSSNYQYKGLPRDAYIAELDPHQRPMNELSSDMDRQPSPWSVSQGSPQPRLDEVHELGPGQ